MSTLKEIAKVAGVSPGSVSAVLNGKAKERRIAPETCAHIEAVALRMGFQGNTLARSLKVGRSNLIGVVGHSYPTYHVQRTREAARVFIEAGYQITMQDLLWRPEQEAELLHELLSLKVEGLYIESGAGIYGADDKAHALLCEQARRGFPIVRLDQQKGIPVDVVTVDREQGMYIATRHILELGHRKIVFAIDDQPAPFLQARLKGFRRAMKEQGITVGDKHFVRPLVKGIDDWGYEFEAGQRCLREVLRRPVRPTAMLAANDFIAMGIISTALAEGLHVPDDLAVIGFTDYQEAQLSAVPLTTVAMPFQAMASNASHMLLERIDGHSGKPRIVTLAPELIIRSSCGGVPDRGIHADAVEIEMDGLQEKTRRLVTPLK